VINQAVKDDINFRVFEAMTSGAMLLTPGNTAELTNIFDVGRDLVTYEADNAKDAGEKIKYYLAHEDQRAEIARRGCEKVKQLHSAKVRADQLSELLTHLTVGPRKNKYHCSAVAYLNSSRVCRHRIPHICYKMAHTAASNLVRAIDAGEQVSNSYEGTVVLCKFNLDELGLLVDAHEFLLKISDLLPDSSIISLARIESLLMRNELDSAKELANKMSYAPEELIASIPLLMIDVRKKMAEREEA